MLTEGHLVVRLGCLAQTGPCSPSSPGPRSRTGVLGREFTLPALTYLYFGQDLILMIENKYSIQ